MEVIVDCQVRAESQISPSESPQKVLKAMHSILPDCSYKTTHSIITISAGDIMVLDTIRKSMASRQSLSSLKKSLLYNVDDDSTWFFLNRQAAFVGIAAVCEDAEESPLGPIKITLTSSNIHGVIMWLVRA
ncbi:MAG: hypothetical protein F4Y82_02205 [Cenarchaeum sp. SB0665_bin_23]|nr:hypothetical protein [Cenarchaeum sp. SB0667_bin_13]MXY60915.1 hypothetical protein [Cenarchaeum sp. SB0665_bin_23]MXZ94157.1 hypothetical protein [Cenarchaeum sp. SB0666_bin_15]MYB46653.1 hypothetical protein [Cenarchaeum sp. SB0662_bin_33]MYC79018.1 hypothetical protein [Cenarchaeum sp. SB0661_bin_35]MYD58091.1 hypothetical protein [Cenarchaeum sp. SB0678_bin_8]MYG32566.1 hypothetical protein [Cenarchaeum sp. SB0677_bin_16]MYJ27484.1 hypothetical protein [Cenarchaeum sp. SB0672_bin_9]